MNLSHKHRDSLYHRAWLLAVATIFYNIAEGVVSVWLGLADETLALFGFGIDSFVEVISGIGIWHMTRRVKSGFDGRIDHFERRALQITGVSFYLLAAGLILTGVVSIITRHRPETTFWGVIISVMSLFTMWILIRQKREVGKELGSDAIIADANCTRACMQLSVVLLTASLAYEFTGVGWLDAVGAFVIAAISVREGQEAFSKARGRKCGCCS